MLEESEWVNLTPSDLQLEVQLLPALGHRVATTSQCFGNLVSSQPLSLHSW